MTGRAAVSSLLVGRAARQGYVTVLDQALVSGTNFLTFFLVGRVSEAELGAYNLAFLGLMFAASLQAALITGPLTVLAAKREGEEYARYIASVRRLQAAFSLAAAALALLAAALVSSLGETRAPLLWLLAPAILFWQTQEFARRNLFARGRPGSVLRNDIVTYGTALGLVCGLYATGNLHAITALASVATGSALGALAGIVQLRRDSPPVAGASAREGLAQNWAFARWTLAGALTQWASEQLYPVLTAGLISLEASGVYKALQNVVALSYVIGFAMEAVLTPKAAAAFQEGGRAGLRRFIGKVYLATAPASLGFLALVALAAGPLLHLLYAGRYDPYAPMLAFMTITYALHFLHRPLAMGLRAQENTRPIFTAYLLSTAATFTAGLWLIDRYGLWGAQVGGLLNVLILVAVLWLAWRKSLEAA